ncbi:Ig-like domain-containing protein [Mycolicibacterium sp. Dal123E01]|uniref:Ig-like domain-containing protein n=1 Tax=Mycolicibacterium sp. Dal123E01 TaxID=3457578 RepID=UPI00403E61B6
MTVRPRSATVSSVETTPTRAEVAAAVTTTTTATPAAQQVTATRVPTLTDVGTALRGLRTLLDRVFAPVRAFFEGLALLTRRALFNQVPAVDPIQTTGQTDGQITGDLRGKDADGDSIRYALEQAPMYGAVVINRDGTYTYTPGSDFTGLDSFVVAASDTGPHINLLDLDRPASTYQNVVITQGDTSRATFNFTFADGAKYWTPQAKAALEWAATQVSAYVVADSPVTITIAVTAAYARPKIVGFDPDGQPIYERDCSTGYCSETLASAGSDLADGAGPGFRDTVVQQKIISGFDANGGSPDGTVTVNFGTDWGFGDDVEDDEVDFESTVMHELLHAVGFSDSLSAPNPAQRETWSSYDRFIVDSTGAPVIDSSTYKFNTAFAPNLAGQDGGLYFGGPNARAAYGGVAPLYDGQPSHLNDKVFDDPDPDSKNAPKLMNSNTGDGEGIRVFSAVEIGILKDLGYTIAQPLLSV